MTAFIQAHAAWVVPAALTLSFLKSLAFVSLVVPSSLVIAIIVALVQMGDVSLWPVWVAVSVGAALGDWASYALGDRLKDRARHVWPFTRRPDLMPRGERFFHRWGAMSVVLCRFFSPLRATVPLLCGMFEMPAMVFQFANWSSAFLWAAVVLLIGEGVLRVFG
ncbi:MAG: DedA family protein [Rhodospirillales bacterium]|nr:DedA family protein [Rhodospirillales bacterium]